MRAEFNNGTSVCRIWGDLEDGECLAIFQYTPDAMAFARWRANNDMEHGCISCMYVVADGYNGKSFIVKKPAKNEART